MLYLNSQGVEVLMSRHKDNKKESYWDNYDLVVWTKNSNGYSDSKGLFRKNAWGIAERFKITKEGVWVLPKKYVKYFK